MGIFKNAVTISHNVIKLALKKGDTAVDATCGTGRDTLCLAKLVGETGRVYSFDIQKKAIELTRLLLVENNALQPVVLINDDNRQMEAYIPTKAQAIMFNLGYLPGGDHSIKTTGDATLEAIEIALKILNNGGLITVVFYPGHPGGLAEFTIVRNFLATLPQKLFEVTEIQFTNQINNPPRIIIVQKL